MENSLLGLDSIANAVVLAKNMADVEHRDVFCFGHLLFEMCMGFELTTAQPTAAEMNSLLKRQPQVLIQKLTHYNHRFSSNCLKNLLYNLNIQ